MADNTLYYFPLESGKNIDDLYNDMFSNRYDSLAKKTVDNWYKNNLINYSKYLVDEEWCGSRNFISDSSLNGAKPTSNLNNTINFDRNMYNREEGTPQYTCVLKNDTYTVNNKEIGNGYLTYPIALLTADELISAGLSGISTGDYSINNYLNTGFNTDTNDNWYTMTPACFNKDHSDIIVYGYNGRIYGSQSTHNYGIRPSISLKKGIKIASGDGTEDNPYVIN